MEMTLLADVALPLTVEHPFTYMVPPEMASRLSIGRRIIVPFGHRRVTGYVIKLYTGEKAANIKPIEETVDLIPLFPPSMVPFFQWIADYYIHPLGMVIKTALPPGLAIKSNVVFTGALDISDNTIAITKSEPEQNALNVLKKQNFLPLSWHAEEFSKAECIAALRSLEERGVITKSVRTLHHGVRPRMINVVRLLPLGSEEKASLTPRQMEVVEYLQNEGSVAVSELAKAVPGADSIVRALTKKGVAAVSKKPVHRTPLGDDIILDSEPVQLTQDQEQVFSRIKERLDAGSYSPFLLHGVTGSGKTEIYMRAIEHTLRQNRSALVLVPEITLSLSLEALFRARFGDKIGLIHSGLSQRDAYEQWVSIASGRAPLTLGARSAIFAPMDRPGLIIVDEEHDPSYKQDDRLRYNARDLALLRGSMAGAVVILGSATPSLRTYRNAIAGKTGYLSLSRRVFDRPLPEVEIVDMRKEPGKGYLSGTLVAAIRETLGRNEQIILFLNRRGYSPVVLCPRCGETVGCPNCQISLTYHQGRDNLMCHYCGHSQPLNTSCPTCGGSPLIPLGIGTERLETEIQLLFPEAKITRLDSDTAPKRKEMFNLLKELRRGDIDILVGTQMIVKGHDFPNVTLVGVLSADQSLHFPDFSASERTFQLLAQVSGRAGRGSKPGRVIIQSYNPDHYSIVQAKGHAFHPFYLDEIINRSEFRYPPFSRLVRFSVNGEDPQETAQAAEQVAEAVKSALIESGVWGRILGPAPAPLFRLKGKHRWHVLLMGASPSALNCIARHTLKAIEKQKKGRGVTVSVDIDPGAIL